MIVFIVNFLYENTNNKFRFKDIILILLGIIISVFINYIPSDIFNLNSIFSLFVFGLLVAVALILPGISVSYILLIFSCYDNIIYAIKNFDFLLLIRIGFFVIIGIILTIKLIENALIKYKKNTNLIISGFMIGSFYTFIKIPATIFLINEMVIFLMIGILFFLIFDKIIKK
jgi:putative membrane protein